MRSKISSNAVSTSSTLSKQVLLLIQVQSPFFLKTMVPFPFQWRINLILSISENEKKALLHKEMNIQTK